GQLSLFGVDAPVQRAGLSVARSLPPANDYRREDLIFMEKDMLGVYISDHPLSDVAEQMERIVTMDAGRLAAADEDEQIEDGMTVTMAGIVTAKKTLITKKGQMMAFITLEDLCGTVETVVFPKAYGQAEDRLQEDRILVIRGKLDTKAEGAAKLLADKIWLLAEYEEAREEARARRKNNRQKPAAPEQKTPMIKLVIPETFQESEGLLTFRNIAREFRGDMPVAVLVACTGKKYQLDYDLWVEPTEAFFSKIREVFGGDCIRP
ncbi:MAG: OB-fold nucleic acid binding domain-containing protein, partial [Eubacteriales bacterium]|nr:OB-fold nucleic acid binding domain-containing protein [Eubacteriales bacterium]